LAEIPLLPVLRVADAARAVADTEALVGCGLPSIELTATTPGWEEALRAVRSDHPDLLLGLGTVRDLDTARRAVAIGVDFLVTPHAVAGVSGAEGVDGVPVVTGCLTPTELAAAAPAGLVKLFPAHVGGPEYLQSLLAVMPELAVVPTGGIEPDDVPAWLDAGAVGVGVGSALTRRLAHDPEAVAAWVRGLQKSGRKHA
jgi:2-dehydro-3-deoxyphosphogluconate aldolase/(4S)-4-hydroxy-2-oxoglutarate aldolase